jgi:MraZ protein
MSLIVGVEYCKIDGSGRFKLPIALKKQLNSTEDNRFVIRNSIYNPCLELFTYASFQSEVKELQEKLNPYDPKAKRLYRKFTQANIIELDSFDRILIPSQQRQDVNIEKEIVVVASGKFMEVWDATTYKNIDKDNFDYEQAAMDLLGEGNKVNDVVEK